MDKEKEEDDDSSRPETTDRPSQPSLALVHLVVAHEEGEEESDGETRRQVLLEGGEVRRRTVGSDKYLLASFLGHKTRAVMLPSIAGTCQKTNNKTCSATDLSTLY